MAIPTLGAGLVELVILSFIFHKSLKEKIITIDEDQFVIKNKATLIVGVVHLFVCLVFLIISSYINVEMWLISAICSGSLLIYTIIASLITKKDWNYVTGALKKLPYPLIPFFLSMFVIVVALNYQGITEQVASFFGSQNTIWVYGYTSFIASNVINNIPMSILYSNLSSGLTGLSYKSAIYASIIGSNIGAFLTPMGALAGIMFTNLLEEHDVKFSIINFIKYGVIIAIPTISAALALLLITINF